MSMNIKGPTGSSDVDIACERKFFRLVGAEDLVRVRDGDAVDMLRRG
jgi:hypothetical protein